MATRKKSDIHVVKMNDLDDAHAHNKQKQNHKKKESTRDFSQGEMIDGLCKNDSFHITMTDSDEMQLKHRSPAHHFEHKNSHANQGYNRDEINGSRESLSPQNQQRLPPQCNNKNNDENQPQIFHMNVYDPNRKEPKHFDIDNNQSDKFVINNEGGYVSPPYSTPPTSPSPPPLQNLKIADNNGTTKHGNSTALYIPESFVEQKTGFDLDESFSSIIFEEMFFPTFVSSLFSHYFHSEDDDNVNNLSKVFVLVLGFFNVSNSASFLFSSSVALIGLQFKTFAEC